MAEMSPPPDLPVPHVRNSYIFQLSRRNMDAKRERMDLGLLSA